MTLKLRPLFQEMENCVDRFSLVYQLLKNIVIKIHLPML